MPHVYIAYSREDGDFVDLIEADLSERGHHAWRDTSSIEEGSDWSDAIQAALKGAYALVVVLSEKSLTSEWVKREVRFAQENNIRIIPIRLESCKTHKEFDDAQVIDFSRVREARGIEQLRLYRQAFQTLISALDETRPVRLYLKRLNDPDDNVREHAVHKLGELGDLSASEALIQALSDPDADVRFAAAEALGKLRCEAALKSLIRVLNDEDPDVSAAAAMGLGQLGISDAIGPLLEQLDHVDRFVRAGAVQALGTLGAAEAVRPLIHLMRNDHISDVRQAAAVALCAIGGPTAEAALRRAGVDCTTLLKKSGEIQEAAPEREVKAH